MAHSEAAIRAFTGAITALMRGGPVTTWTYKGVDVFQADRNSSGIRWYARRHTGEGVLRSDTKEGMRRLITAHLKG